MVKKKNPDFIKELSDKTNKLKDSSKQLRKANYHFAGDILAASVIMKNKAIKASEKNCTRSKTKDVCYKNLLNEIISCMDYITLQANSIQQSTKKEKIKEEVIENTSGKKRKKKNYRKAKTNKKKTS